MAQQKTGVVERNRLVEAHLSLPLSIARQLQRSMPPGCDLDDFVSVGFMALIGAAARYDPGRVKFKTFAQYRIRGAMLDYARALSRELVRVWPVGVRGMGGVYDPRAGPEQLACASERLTLVAETLQSLPPNEQRVFGMRCRGRTLGEIAQELSLSSSQVRWLEQKAVRHLRRAVAAGGRGVREG